MNYKLLALDLDGTLLDASSNISKRNLSDLLKAQSNGLRIILSSGRPTEGMKHIEDALRLSEYGGFLMSYNGGVIISSSDNKVEYSNYLDKRVISPLLEISHKWNFSLVCYHGGYVICEDEENEYIHHSVARNRLKYKNVPSFIKEIEYDISKCIIVGEPKRLEILEKEMQSFMPDLVSAYRSEPFFLEIVPRGIDKAKGLECLLNAHGWKKDELIAIGDSYNDISMIQYAGLGVAMGNARPEVKEAADITTLKNTEDGVSVLLRRMCPYFF